VSRHESNLTRKWDGRHPKRPVRTMLLLTRTANRAVSAGADGNNAEELRLNFATIDRLATHMDVGWDLDGTLVGHSLSPFLHRFIRDHRAIRHVIVTFRTRLMEAQVWSELAQFRTAPDRSFFKGVLHVPDDVISDVVLRRERLGFVRHLAPFSAAEQRFRHWKGQACWEHGLTALVDDMTGMVGTGCRRYGVELFHPSDFIARKARRAGSSAPAPRDGGLEASKRTGPPHPCRSAA
jgi:hypothetical protein